MRRKSLNLVVALYLSVMTTMTVQSQTTFTDADGTNDFISNALNWDNGLPGAGNDGTINIDAGVDTGVTHTNYGNVTHSAGNLSRSNGTAAFKIGSGTNWTMNGTATVSGVRGLLVRDGGTFTLTSTTANFTDNNKDIEARNGGIITVNSGSFQSGRSTTVNNGSFVMNGGSLTHSTSAVFGSKGLSSNGSITINGGTITADRLSSRSGLTITFGGTTAGSATFADFGTGLYTNTGDRAQDNSFDVNFLSGSQIVLDIGSGARGLDFTNDNTANPYNAAWAQALWETDRLKYNGQTSTDLGGLTWADATNSSIGFGSEYFDFTAAGTFGGALKLVAVPEPSTVVLLGLAFATLYFLRRKK